MHIGISGPIASGKSTLGKSLKSVFELLDIPTRIVPFAEDLKWIASLQGNADVVPQLLRYFRMLDYDETTVWRGVAMVLNGFMLHPIVDGLKPRKLYQYLGTEAGRNTVDEDLWINGVKRKINGDSITSYFISDDVRFCNETKALNYHVRISTNGTAAVESAYEARKALYPPEYFFSDHQSENEVLPAADYVIPTNFTTVEVIDLAKHINHKVRSTVVLTQRDLEKPQTLAQLGKAYR